MNNFGILFFSTSQLGGILDIGYTSEQSEIITDLLYVFDAKFDVDKQEVSVDYKQKYTTLFQARLKVFIEKYKSVLPSVQKLGARFGKLEQDEWFFILPPIELNTKQKYNLEEELDILNGRKSSLNEEQLQKFFGDVLDNYEIITFDLDKDKKIKIGEGQKNKRICRFCQRGISDVSFTQEAHAISEALGNKKLILNEECDNCNKFFDENIERDFIYYHDLARTMFGIKNKKNEVPEMKGIDFHFYQSNENNLSIAVVSDSISGEKSGTPESTVFRTGNKIKIQNIYKTLCKFSLSVIGSEHVSHFCETIRWIKDEKEATALPKIAVLNSYDFFTKRPELNLYLRNNNNKKLPYLVGEFRFTFYMYIFIVPFSDKDSRDFLSEEDYEDFLNCFNHVKSKEGFEYIDFSQNVERELSFNINFEKEKTDKIL
ncbi:HNH endonuclease [Vreelandella songnenensis]|uniref:HNH endonuclease n=1 Tax=Vreelandella songnenensis TaxID=1176243 RepID=A0A2T0V820_9GAMM|nr:HNH endonuclease [Halomonas songnenensis]PRY66294.1 HNH endonuclease [Halomonas songnenensis]